MRIAGFSGDYHIATLGKEASITHKTNPTDSRKVDARSTVQFLDRYAVLDAGGSPGQIYRLYKAAFNRVPDEEGLGFWIGHAAGGVSLEAVAEQFAASSEFAMLYGPQLSNTDFVSRVYGNVLERTPDAGGHAFWLAALDTGASRASVLAAMADSEENKDIVNPRIAHGFTFKPYGADLLPGLGETWIERPMGWTFRFEDYLSANRSWSYNVTGAPGHPVRFGTASERFEVRYGDCGGTDCLRGDGIRERAEVAQVGTQNYQGETWWYGISFYVPPDYKDSGNAIGTSRTVSMFQYHQTPENPAMGWFPAWMFAKEYNGPFVARAFASDPYMTPIRYELWPASSFVGRWHDVVVEAKWSTGDDGFMRMWMNGTMVLDHRGATRSPGNKDIYFKYGVYRPSTPATQINTVLYFDEVRRGSAREQVDIRLIEKMWR